MATNTPQNNSSNAFPNYSHGLTGMTRAEAFLFMSSYLNENYPQALKHVKAVGAETTFVGNPHGIDITLTGVTMPITSTFTMYRRPGAEQLFAIAAHNTQHGIVVQFRSQQWMWDNGQGFMVIMATVSDSDHFTQDDLDGSFA